MDNPYRQASYVLNAARLSQLPQDFGREVAFAGRSNAGKSSAINYLTDQKSLARTSKTPGRTQQIVVFDVDLSRRIIDLPGYGYAKVPEKMKKEWQLLMGQYFETRSSLKGVVLVMDIRHPMRPFDTQMLEWCRAVDMPCHILLTKSDKLKRGAAQSTLLGLKRQLPAKVSLQLFSALKKTGREQLIEKLNEWFEFEKEREEIEAS
jgi:GTP-binding protein